MIKIGYQREIHKAKYMPQEVVDVVGNVLAILDSEYGDDRNVDVYGGYVLMVESVEDFQKLKEDIYLDIVSDAIPEYVDIVKCSNGEAYTNSLILCNNDFGITLIMKLDITPDNLKEYVME